VRREDNLTDLTRTDNSVLNATGKTMMKESGYFAGDDVNELHKKEVIFFYYSLINLNSFVSCYRHLQSKVQHTVNSNCGDWLAVYCFQFIAPIFEIIEFTKCLDIQ
jgi:hypothetical protein